MNPKIVSVLFAAHLENVVIQGPKDSTLLSDSNFNYRCYCYWFSLDQLERSHVSATNLGRFESIHSSLYRKELRCPFCGFDPSWYKKDVKFARQKVEEFLKQNPDSPVFRRIKAEESSSKTLN